ncbi:MAG: hypothetical protein NWT04_06375 [Verrucomicrobiales bacterium]|jgi:hypothetical protein|nr:hypothetical protein [Verrucomicrobiales bacterium]MDP4790716.1 hypothetical protein [Verrucomicrobiales bacterium]MDP5005462.1 hypothetical protein [Verrucomicrobiales bacterium]
MIVIDRFYSLGEAESARMELGYHGINSLIEHENTATLTPFLMTGRKSGIELKIAVTEADAAREVLDEWKARHAEAAGDPPFVPYLLASLIGAVMGLLLIKPLLTGAVLGLLISLIVITIYNRGIDKGYKAARAEREEDEEG